MDKNIVNFYKAVSKLEVAVVKAVARGQFGKGGNYVAFADEKVSKVLRKAVKKGFNADDIFCSCNDLVGKLLEVQVTNVSMPSNEAFRNSKKGSVFTITMMVKEPKIEPARVRA